MKKILLLTALLLTLGGGIAYANDTTSQPDINIDDYNFTLAGAGVCQTDGTYLLTWTIVNVSTAPYTNSNPVMTLLATSKDLTSSTVDALGTASFTQSVDGKVAASFTQSITGAWNTDADDTRTETATVSLSAPCVQPVPQNVKPAVTTPTVLGAQTVTPIVAPIVPGFHGGS